MSLKGTISDYESRDAATRLTNRDETALSTSAFSKLGVGESNGKPHSFELVPRPSDAPVDGQRIAHDIVARARGKKYRSARHVLGRADPAGGNLLGQGIALVAGELVHVGSKCARRDGGHDNVLRREFECEALGQMEQPRLGGGV